VEAGLVKLVEESSRRGLRALSSTRRMDGDLPAPDLEARQRDLDERLLIVEAELGRLMSIADIMIAKETAERRYRGRFPLN
jgi:hypothetical protein